MFNKDKTTCSLDSSSAFRDAGFSVRDDDGVMIFARPVSDDVLQASKAMSRKLAVIGFIQPKRKNLYKKRR